MKLSLQLVSIVTQLYEFLSSYEVSADVGSRWEYSNMDAGLLALALARRTSTTFDELLRSRISAPLGMHSTRVTLTPGVASRLAAGHNAKLEPAQAWNVPVLAGAGSLHSTANDLLTLLAATMGHVKSPLAPAMASMLSTRRPGPGFQQALGWWIFGTEDDEIITHVGGTHGHATSVTFDPRRGVGIVILSNSINTVSDLATRVLRPPVAR